MFNTTNQAFLNKTILKEPDKGIREKLSNQNPKTDRQPSKRKTITSNFISQFTNQSPAEATTTIKPLLSQRSNKLAAGYKSG